MTRQKKHLIKKSLVATSISLLLGLMAGCNSGGESTDGEGSAPSTGALTNAPSVDYTMPPEGSNRIALDANLSAGFTVPIAINSVDDVQFTLEYNNTPVVASIQFDGTTAVLNPFEDLRPSTLYTAKLKSGIVDLEGNPLQDYSWSFYTDGNGWAPDAAVEMDNSGDADMPQIAFDGFGNAHAVWRHNDGSRDNIYSNRYDAISATWGNPVLLEQDDLHSASKPHIDVNAYGDAQAVWQQNDGTRFNILASRYTASSATWATAELIELNNAGQAFTPQVALDNDGNAIAVWYQNTDSSYNIFANRYDATSGSWGTASVIEIDSSGTAFNPKITIDTGGNAHAVWYEIDSTGYQNIYANHFNASTGSWETAERIEEENAGSASHPSVAMNNNGDAFAVWHQHDGTRNKIYANRYDASTGWGTAESIENNNAGGALHPQVTLDAQGNAYVVWYQSDGSRDSIYANRFNESTGNWEGAELIESSSVGHATNPRIGVDTFGNAHAVWFQDDGSNKNIYANRYIASTGSWETAVLVETNDNGDANEPQIALDANGNGLAVWKQNDGSLSSIHSAPFDPNVIAP